MTVSIDAVIIITAETAHMNAYLTGDGQKLLSLGENTFNIAVTAENGNTKTYTVKVNRAHLKGDVNGDGSITLADVVLTKRIIVQDGTFTGFQTDAADIDGIDGVTTTDLVLIKKYILGIITEF